MKRKFREQKLYQRDNVVVALSLLGFLLCGALLVSDNFYSIFFEESKSSSLSRKIGEIAFAKNDIRHKDSNSLVWEKAAKSQDIHLGDRVFTGEKSQSQVKLKSGGAVDLDENSMITFALIDSLEIPNLVVGSFKLAVEGKIKIAIHGKVTEIEGKGSEVQVLLDGKNKSQITLLKGEAQFKDEQGKIMTLTKDITASFEKESVESAVIEQKNQIKAVGIKRPVIYTDQVDDFFETRNGLLYLREDRRTFFKVNTEISWTDDGAPPVTVFAQLSNAKDFKSTGELLSVKSPATSGYFSKAYAGENFYRLSSDGQSWGPAQVFQLITQPLQVQPPELSLGNHSRVFIRDRDLSVPIVPRGNFTLSHFIIEVSENIEFNPKSTKVFWATAQGISLSFADPQSVYLRVRGVNSQYQITSPSPVTKLDVERGAEPQILAQEENSFNEGASRLQMRKPSTIIDHSVYKMDPEIPTYLNRNYQSSKFSLEGGGLISFSQEQIAQEKNSPTSVNMGLRLIHWFGSSGIEGSFKSKVANLSNSDDGGVSPLQAEARYHYRFTMPVSPFSDLGSSQMSVILGYEFYRNSAGGLFSPKYDLVKTGLAFTFPMLSRWETGGELLYGYGLDQSSKYEISGFLSFYIQQDWSLGAGYRAYMFEAGSVASSPLGLPYREAFGEGYLMLRWSY